MAQNLNKLVAASPTAQAGQRRRQRAMKNTAVALGGTPAGSVSSSQTGALSRRDGGTVTAVGSGTVNLIMGGAESTGVPHLASYVPQVGDQVLVDFLDHKPLVVGTRAALAGSPQLVLEDVQIGVNPPASAPPILRMGNFVVLATASNWSWPFSAARIPFGFSYGYAATVSLADNSGGATVDLVEAGCNLNQFVGQVWAPGSAAGINGLIRVAYSILGA